ncbi:hypothetical protein VPNG_05706 [Cytospora leucostoma]|uniref:Uncharacterized protein n=1 Tax=Cytospora leucostoma TaxID=1230097 RepID=A0A423X043_9PEZI|nr:hypothetical protein VPNG_05706 [Cytospora leucostoma]
MNTVKSFWLGWGSLIVAGGGAYVFAKRNINAERKTRLEEQLKRKGANQDWEEAERAEKERLAASSAAASQPVNDGTPVQRGVVGHPGREIDYDPAPVKHQPATEFQRQKEKAEEAAADTEKYRSKYEAPKPYRSPKGDRFS